MKRIQPLIVALGLLFAAAAFGGRKVQRAIGSEATQHPISPCRESDRDSCKPRCIL